MNRKAVVKLLGSIFEYATGYAEHNGQVVEVLEEKPALTRDDKMYKVRAPDGWTGHLYSDELTFE